MLLMSEMSFFVSELFVLLMSDTQTVFFHLMRKQTAGWNSLLNLELIRTVKVEPK